MKDHLNKESAVRFVFPMDGDCLNEHDGRVENGILYVAVKVVADEKGTVRINGIPAAFKDGFFVARVPLSGYENEIMAADGMGNTAKIKVFCLQHATGIFRLSSDDNILFLQDIHENRDIYASIFDNPYLAIYKKAHDQYGACVQLNLCYAYEQDLRVFSDQERGSFDLSLMTDKFKAEFTANADWLHLSFHGREPQSVSPYAHVPGAVMAADAEAVYREVIRFAGQAPLSRHNTTIHYGDCDSLRMRAMHHCGLRGAYGYFDLDKRGATLVSYGYPKELVEHIHGRDFWYDTAEDMLYGKIDLVLNLCEASEVEPLLEELKKDPHRAGCVELMIHEQYFYQDYVKYMPTFEENVLAACRWCAENGYRGYFMQDLLPS